MLILLQIRIFYKDYLPFSPIFFSQQQIERVFKSKAELYWFNLSETYEKKEAIYIASNRLIRFAVEGCVENRPSLSASPSLIRLKGFTM